MDYEIQRTRKAQNQFNALSSSLQVRVAAHFLELGKWPTQLSRPIGSLGSSLRGMLSEFSHGPIDGVLHHFGIIFQYSQDEKNLIILAIGHSELPAVGMQ